MGGQVGHGRVELGQLGGVGAPGKSAVLDHRAGGGEHPRRAMVDDPHLGEGELLDGRRLGPRGLGLGPFQAADEPAQGVVARGGARRLVLGLLECTAQVDDGRPGCRPLPGVAACVTLAGQLGGHGPGRRGDVVAQPGPVGVGPDEEDGRHGERRGQGHAAQARRDGGGGAATATGSTKKRRATVVASDALGLATPMNSTPKASTRATGTAVAMWPEHRVPMAVKASPSATSSP